MVLSDMVASGYAGAVKYTRWPATLQPSAPRCGQQDVRPGKLRTRADRLQGDPMPG